MSRRHIAFACEDDILVGTLDDAQGTSALLIVTGGNETRAGAFSGQAELAARVAEAGHPVMRFDRRGVGDASGENAGFTGSGRDIAAALATLLVEKPEIQRVVGFGNCDAASALMLFAGAGCHSLVLANPWTFEGADDGPPPEAIRARYSAKLKDPKEVWRLLTGGVSMDKLASGLARALKPAAPPTTLAQDMAAGLEEFEGPVRILIAANDRTGQAFRAALPQLAGEICPDAGHSFGEPHARDWLFAQLLSALQE